MFILDVLHPDALAKTISIFGINITFYAIIILGGAIINAIFGYYKFAKPLGMDDDTVLTGVAIGLLCGILGARIYYVIFNHDGITNILEALNPRNGGLAIHGGIIATAIFLFVFCRVKHIKLWTLVEIVVPIFMTCQVIGRWGNFMNQEAYGPLIRTFGDLSLENIQAHVVSGSGTYFNPYMLSDEVLLAQRETLQSWLIPNFIVNNMYIQDGSLLIDGVRVYVSGYYHPTFLYESLMNLAVVIFMYVGRKHIKKYYIADSLCIYLMGYGIIRFIIEILRQDPLTIGNTGIKVAQLISILFFVGGLALFILRRVFKYNLVSCKDVFYSDGGSLYYEGYSPKELKAKKEAEHEIKAEPQPIPENEEETNE